MFCRTQSTSLTLWFSSFSRLPSGRRIPHFCEKKSILCRISIDEAGKQCSIAILFLFVHSPQATIAKWNIFTLNPAHWSGIQCARKSERLTGARSQPRTSHKFGNNTLKEDVIHTLFFSTYYTSFIPLPVSLFQNYPSLQPVLKGKPQKDFEFERHFVLPKFL